MKNCEMLTMLRDLVGNKHDDIVLSTYLTLAGEKIINKAYPYASDDEELSVPRKYHALQVQIAAYMINKRGAEGQTQHIENGMHRNYGSADVPDDMLSEIVPFVGVIGQ